MSVKSPQDWGKAVAVARYRMCGMSAAEVAGLVGVSTSSVKSWEDSSWWSEALREAATAEFSHLAAKALGVVKDKIEDGDVNTARWFLAKVHPTLSDRPQQRIQGPEQKALPDLDGMSDDELRALAAGENIIDVEFESE